MRHLLQVVLFLGVLVGSAQAVIVYDGTAANLSAPTDDPGWDAVGRFTGTGVGSAVFLGNFSGSAWFLTANHVPTSSNTLQIASQSFTSFFDVQQIGTADLKVFRLNTEITGVTPVTLAKSAPVVGNSAVMIGNGATGPKTTWDISTSPWTSPGGGAEGYTWSGPNVLRWGTNNVHERDYVSGGTTYFTTDFEAAAGEAAGSLGDSGGAVFIKKGGTWELAGIMLAVGVLEDGVYKNNFTGQPGSTSVASITDQPNNKSVTFSAQISTYEAAIMAAIPEPSSTSLLAIAVLALYRARRHRRRFGDDR